VNLLKAAFSVSSWTFLSRITGLLRETLLLRAFGAGVETDAFNIAFRLPNLLRRLFAEGAFSQAFVPLLGNVRTRDGDQAARELIDHVSAALLWAVGLVSLIGVLAAPLLVWLIGSGLAGRGFDEATVMTRIMFPYIGCMSLVAFAAAILNTWRRFSIAAAAPVLLNVCMIAGILLAPYLLPKESQIYGVAIGVMIGGVAQLLAVWWGLSRIGLRPAILKTPRTAFGFAGVKRVLSQMGPALLGVSVAQISVIINTQIATHLGEGRVSWITAAERLLEFPSALLGVALGVVLTPSLTRAVASGNNTDFSGLLDWGLRLTLLLALPAALGMVMMSEALTAILYHYGKFSTTALMQTAAVVQAYAIGVVGFTLVKILAPGFYAQQDLRSPVKIALLVLASTQIGNFFLVPHLQHVALALTISLGALLNAGLLFWGLQRKGKLTLQPGWLIFFVKIALALAAMGLTLWFTARGIDWVALQSQSLLRIVRVLALIALAASVYFAVLGLLGFRLKDFKRRDAS
jgi:putative peptidoglycan lipid II flippase